MSLTLLNLKSELLNDPSGLGYSTFINPTSARDNITLATILNTRRATIQVSRESIPTMRLFSNINATDFLALTTLQLQELQVILTQPFIDLNDTSVRSILQGIFTGKTATLNNFTNLRNRNGSRYEQLTNPGEVVTSDYISQALDS